MGRPARQLHGDPARPLRPPRKRGVEPTRSREDRRRAIRQRTTAATGSRCTCCSRRGSQGRVQGVQFRHFDHAQRRLTVFTKGGKVQTLPIVDPGVLERPRAAHPRLGGAAERVPALPPAHDASLGLAGAQEQEAAARPDRPDRVPRPADGRPRPAQVVVPLPRTGGVVATGPTSGERMHKARHTAGQRVLDHTNGNLKAAQKRWPLVDLDDRRHLHRLGHRPARGDAARRCSIEAETVNRSRQVSRNPRTERLCAWQESNLRPRAPEARALSPELQARSTQSSPEHQRGLHPQAVGSRASVHDPYFEGGRIREPHDAEQSLPSDHLLWR